MKRDIVVMKADGMKTQEIGKYIAETLNSVFGN